MSQQKVIIQQFWMTQSNPKVEFHPKRLTRSRSRQNFSPYRKKAKKDKMTDFFIENKVKIENNHPIIKFKELIGNSHSNAKLKLQTQKCYTHAQSQATTQSNSTFNPHVQTQSSNSYNLLLVKMQEQTNFIRHHFTEMKKDLRLPKLSYNQQQNQRKEPSKQYKYEQNQKIIMNYLQELSRNNREIQILKNINQSYEDQLAKLKIQISQWQEKCTELEKELIIQKIQKQSEKYDSFNLQHCQQIKNIKQKTLHFKQVPINVFTGQDSQISETDCLKQNKKMQNQINTLKLSLEMLQQEIKLLNYSLNQRDQQIVILKEKINRMNHKVDVQMKKTNKLSFKSIGSSSINMHQRNHSQFRFQHSIDKKIQQIQNKLTNKSLSKILFQSVKSDQEIEDNQGMKVSQSRKVLSCHDGGQSGAHINKNGNINQLSKILITAPLCQVPKQYMRKSVSLLDYSRFNMTKSYLKNRRKDSYISQQNRQKLKKQMKTLHCFNQQRMYTFNLIRRTLAYKFKGLKYTYQQFQSQMIKKQDNILTAKNINKILSQHPFLLGTDLLPILLEYISTQKRESANQLQISADQFCNKMREFIPDYEPIYEEEEVRAIQKIKKTIIACQAKIMFDLSQHQIAQGIIDQQNLSLILQDYNFTDIERQAIISQCCIISSDADHLSYALYLSIFQYNQ